MFRSIYSVNTEFRKRYEFYFILFHYKRINWMTYTIFTFFVSNPLGRPKRKFSLNSSTPNQENATVSIDRLWEAETNPSAFKNPIDMFYRKDFSFLLTKKRRKMGLFGQRKSSCTFPSMSFICSILQNDKLLFSSIFAERIFEYWKRCLPRNFFFNKVFDFEYLYFSQNAITFRKNFTILWHFE